MQVHNQLRQLILSGQWPYGSRIPSENDFVEALRLSRSTIRLALQQSELEGLIERVAGRGTFVIYQSAKAQTNRVIAFLTSGIDAENQLQSLSGIESEAKSRGYQVIFTKAESHQEELDIITALDGKEAGIVLWSNGVDSVHKGSVYQQFQIPIVLLDRTIKGFESDLVTSDNYGGASSLLQHIVELGHKHIVLLTHKMGVSTIQDRYRAYRDVLQEHGLTPHEPWLIGLQKKEISFRRMVRASLDSRSLEHQQIKDYILNAQPRPTAIFAINDLLAILTLRSMKLLEIAVPDTISIAGFDDMDMAAHLDVPLTTVAQDSYLLGKTAAEVLINRIEGFTGPAITRVLPTQLRIRSSTSLPVSV